MGEAKLANYVRTTLAEDLATDTTEFDVAAVTGFPSLGAGDYFYLVLVRLSDNAKEVVKVTGVSGTTLTATRAQESTTAKTFSTGDRCELWLTAGGLNDRLDLKVNISDIVDNVTSTDTDKPLSANQGKVLKTAVDAKVATADIVDNLTSTDTNKPLSANQGKVLKTAVDLKVATADIVDNLTSTDTNKPLSANQGKTLSDRMEFGGIRQTVLYAKTTSGLPDFLAIDGNDVDLDASVSTPFLVSFAYGFDGRGPVDYVHIIVSAALSWVDAELTDNDTNYLYIDRASNGTWTLSASIYEPIYSFDEPSSPSTGQHWFNLNAMIMEVWSGSAWTSVTRVFVGEADVAADGSVTAVRCYAIRGIYTSGWFSVVQNTTYTKSHNIGVESHWIEAMVLYRQSSAYAGAEMRTYWGVSASHYGTGIGVKRLAVKVAAANGFVHGYQPLVAAVDAGDSSAHTSGEYCVIAKRRW